MLDESQVKMLQRMGEPKNIRIFCQKNYVYVVEQQIQVMEQSLIVSVLYISNIKPTAAQSLPPAKGQQPLINMGAIKAAYEQS